MSSRELIKFNEWAQKIRSTLETLPNKEAYVALPNQCKFLRDWGDKLEEKNSREYLGARKTESDLLSRAAHELHSHYDNEFLKKAKKHKLRTKVRMYQILRFIYYYSKDVHTNFVRAEKREQTLNYLVSFWKSYNDEINGFIDGGFLNDFQKNSIRKLLEQTKEVGGRSKFVNELTSKLDLAIAKPKVMSRILKGLYRDELLVLADVLSENRRRWTYDKRSRKSMAEAIAQNCSEDDLANWLKEFCGKELPRELQRKDLKVFPSAIQVGTVVLGPLGLIEGKADRSRFDSQATRIILEEYLGKEDSLRSIWKEIENEIPYKPPKEIFEASASQKRMLIQVILAHARDVRIRTVANLLLDQGKIQIDVSGHHEEVEGSWIVTKHGLVLRSELKKESVENLADLLRDEFAEEDLASEIGSYHGDFESRLLEYCIKENPEEILTRIFGLVRLKQLAKKLGFARVDPISDPHEAAALIMLKFGFNVPPSLVGLKQYIDRLQQCRAEMNRIVDSRMKSGLMSQVYVNMEGFLKNLLFFYAGFLWSKEIEDTSWRIKYEEAMRQILKNKLRVETPERLTFGETIHALRKLNTLVKGEKGLRGRMQKDFNRNSVLNAKYLETLDRFSGLRKKFVHSDDEFPGNKICFDLIDDMLSLMEEFRQQSVYPYAIRIVAEISDDYGKNYSRAIDENGCEWTIYSKEWLDATVPYFMHSKTSPIAVNPILVQKIRS